MIINKFLNHFKALNRRHRFLSHNVKVIGDKKGVLVLGEVFFFGEPSITISSPCVIYPNVSFAGDGVITIGENCRIGKNCSIYSSKNGGVFVGSNVSIAANSYIIDCDHLFDSKDIPINKQGFVCDKVTLADDVWIGDSCTILMGSYISTGCVIGAKSLVKSKTEPYSVYVGAPIKKLKSR